MVVYIVTNQSNDKTKVHAYILDIALKEESSIARELDKMGFAGMIRSNGKANRSAVFSALLLISSGKKNLIPRKDASN
jgi:hypothetical protein